MSILSLTGFGAVGVVVIAWLVVSFRAPGAGRTRWEWLGGCALYIALLSLFVSLTLRALASGHTFAAWALGFLGVAFAVGLTIALVQFCRTFRESVEASASATN